MTEMRRSMGIFEAVLIVDGETEADEEKALEAWQLLIDSGLCWRLQGSYGRIATDLISEGLCTPAESALLAAPTEEKNHELEA